MISGDSREETPSSRSETPNRRAEGEPGHKQTPSLTTSPSLPLADRTRTIRMMAQAPLGASAHRVSSAHHSYRVIPHFSHRRFSRTVIATSRIPTSPINAQSSPAVHILLYNARIVANAAVVHTPSRETSHTIPHFVEFQRFQDSVGVQQWAQSFSTAVVQIPPRTTRALCHFAGVVHASASQPCALLALHPIRMPDRTGHAMNPRAE